jgi:hypothetical protein
MVFALLRRRTEKDGIVGEKGKKERSWRKTNPAPKKVEKVAPKPKDVEKQELPAEKHIESPVLEPKKEEEYADSVSLLLQAMLR